MNKDRAIQLITLLVAAVALVGSAILIPSINHQRRELQLTYEPVVGEGISPQTALLTTAAGSFRGILVDWFWYRAEMLKRDGQYHEANSLAEAIVTLQPRFPQVWSFNAWNQAYNISVGTYTAEERWDWVSKGERMLRTRGIPYNPNSVVLYKELAWIWFHKIGGNTDDFHNYYKLQVAEEWEEVLGPPPPGADESIVLEWFAPLREAADEYFVFGRPSYEMDVLLGQLSAEAPAFDDQIEKIGAMDVIRLRDALVRLQRNRQWDASNKQANEIISELIGLADDARRRSEADPLALLYASEHGDQARVLIEDLRDRAAASVDDASVLGSVKRMGRLASMIRVTSTQQLIHWAQTNLPGEEQQLLAMMLDPERREQWRAVLPFLRARAMVRGMNMDPGKMYQAMAEYGPLDWRHPWSHALYWSRLGVERSGILIDRTKVDQLNTYRGIIHALQSLTHAGRVNYEPMQQRVNYQPDPRFIDSYLTAVIDGTEWIHATDDQVAWGKGVIKGFEAGHENFLQVAVAYEYLYGREDKARERYEYLRETYGDKEHNQRKGDYKLSLEQFVTVTFLEDGDMKKINEGFIDALLYRAFTDGLAQRRVDVFNRFLTIAKASYDRYNQMRANPSSEAYAGDGRLTFKSFRDEMVPGAFARFLREPAIRLDVRSTAYRFAPTGLQRLAYATFHKSVLEQIQSSFGPEGTGAMAPQAEVVLDRLFPKPPGLELEPDQADAAEAEKTGQTIQRK